MINNVTINGRPIGIFVDDVPPGPEPEPFVQYNYTTFKARTTGKLCWDPIGGVVKKFNNSTSKDLTTGTSMGTHSAGGSSDWPSIAVTQDHIYELVWSLTDLQSTFSTLNGNNSTYYYSGSQSPNNIFGELYSIDFWYGKQSTYNYSSPVFGNVTIIPQDYRNLHNGGYLQNCSNMFKNAHITNSIEKFILAMQQACPNLTTTTGCFSGCTTAPDYNYCLTTYPNWF